MRLQRHAILLLTLLLLAGGVLPSAQAQGTSLPTGFSEFLVTNGLSRPTTMTFAPDGRLFVALQDGDLRIIDNHTLLATPFLSLTVDSAGERGLLGVTFDPSFTTNHYVYVYYTVPSSPPHNRVSRFTANGNVALTGSEVILLELNNLTGATNHNGGAMHFGPADSKLYIAVGENATPSNAQTLNNLLGKMLRINKDGTIPTTNPFYNSATGQNRAIWTLGLRNPFTFAFQPGTSRMFINDVGQNTWEEINAGIVGSNYGWPTTEGPASNPAFREPLYAYQHSQGCAITGGVFYNPATNQLPADYTGDYFFADYCGNWIRRYDVASDSAQDFATNTPAQIVDLDVDVSGSLYYLARQSNSNNGAVYRISYIAGLTPPSITRHPVSQTIPVGEAVTFSCTAQGSLPLAYRWQRNGSTITGEKGTSYTISAPSLSDNGASFSCVVSNLAGSALSNAALLTMVNGQRPNPVIITSPVIGAKYEAGETISYSGSASDPEDGTLPPSAYNWEVVFHHETHTHPFVAPHSGVTSATFTTPVESHRSINIWYRIHLTVTDSTNLTRSVYRDINPKTVRITLDSIPLGLQINVDGQPETSHYTLDEVVGTNWNLEAITPQILGSTEWNFKSWSDGGSAVHTLVVPAVNTAYTATYFACPVLQPSAPNTAPIRNFFTIATPSLTWERVTGAVSYEIEVDNTPDFSDPEYENAAIPNDILSITTDTLHDCLYYWHVRAKLANGSLLPWSATERFIVDVP